MVQQEAPSLVFLMKTKLPVEEMKKKRDLIGFRNSFMVSSEGKSGGLALFWNQGTDISIQGSTKWYIDAIIDSGGTMGRWRFTSFYEQPETSKREET